MDVVPQELPIPKLSQRLGQEVRRPHPLLDRGVEMLDRLTMRAFSPEADRDVVAPPRPRAYAPIADAALRPRGALRFERHLEHLGPVVSQIPAVLFTLIATDQPRRSMEERYASKKGRPEVGRQARFGSFALPEDASVWPVRAKASGLRDIG